VTPAEGKGIAVRLVASVGAALLLCCVLSGRAAAREVQVVGDQARLRDLLPGTAITDPADPLLDTLVATDLMPGERRLLTPAEMLLRLSQAGVEAEARGWYFPENITVTRRCQVAPAEDMVRAGEEAIRRSLALVPGDEMSIAVIRKPRALLAPVGELALRALAEPPRLPGGLWLVAVLGEVDGASAVNCDLRYRVTVIGEVLVTNRSVRRHETLDASHVVFARRALSAAGGVPLRDPAELANRRAVRAVPAGTIVTAAWAPEMPLVGRGDLVLASVHVGPVVVCERVEALADANQGERVRVRAQDGTREYLAWVSRPGCVEVTVAP